MQSLRTHVESATAPEHCASLRAEPRHNHNFPPEYRGSAQRVEENFRASTAVRALPCVSNFCGKVPPSLPLQQQRVDSALSDYAEECLRAQKSDCPLTTVRIPLHSPGNKVESSAARQDRRANYLTRTDPPLLDVRGTLLPFLLQE